MGIMNNNNHTRKMKPSFYKELLIGFFTFQNTEFQEGMGYYIFNQDQLGIGVEDKVRDA